MVKPLTFKGDKKAKKRKRDAPSQSVSASSLRSQPLKPTALEDPEDDGVAAAGHDDDDTWVSAEAVSDVGGPVMLVLPSRPPSALACDAGGTVFALPIENMVDENPGSAEPHDARQVWIASRVAGTEHLRLKGRNGRYLSCDKLGVLSASSQAVSPLESFLLTAAPRSGAGPAFFRLETTHSTVVTAREGSSNKGPDLGAAPVEAEEKDDEVAASALLRVRMQARFKPKHKQDREERARELISRRELEEAAGRRLDEGEVRRLKRARREGDYHEQLLAIKVKNKHDKFG